MRVSINLFYWSRNKDEVSGIFSRRTQSPTTSTPHWARFNYVLGRVKGPNLSA